MKKNETTLSWDADGRPVWSFPERTVSIWRVTLNNGRVVSVAASNALLATVSAVRQVRASDAVEVIPVAVSRMVTS